MASHRGASSLSQTYQDLRFNYVYLPVCGCVYMSVGTCGGRKVLNPLELVLQGTVSYPSWVLGTDQGPVEGQGVLFSC